MSPLVETVKPYINHYGYWAVFFGVFLESLGLPIPGETLIIVAGLVAAKGVLNFYLIIVCAILATFIANNFSYMGGYFGGRNFVLQYGKYIFFDEKTLRGLENFVQRYGSKIVIAARFIIGMRQFNGFIAGIAKMPFMKFIGCNFLGAVLWVVWWTSLAYYLGKKFSAVFLGCYFVIGVIALAVVLIILRSSAKKLRQHSVQLQLTEVPL